MELIFQLKTVGSGIKYQSNRIDIKSKRNIEKMNESLNRTSIFKHAIIKAK